MAKTDIGEVGPVEVKELSVPEGAGPERRVQPRVARLRTGRRETQPASHNIAYYINKQLPLHGLNPLGKSLRGFRGPDGHLPLSNNRSGVVLRGHHMYRRS